MDLTDSEVERKERQTENYLWPYVCIGSIGAHRKIRNHLYSYDEVLVHEKCLVNLWMCACDWMYVLFTAWNMICREEINTKR